MRMCPGATAFSQPKIELVPCPFCGGEAEIWSDEADGKCLACGKAVVRTASQSCVDWCKYARECLGDDKYRKYRDMKSAIRKEALVKAMEYYFGDDERRRTHAKTVASFAEKILRESEDENADPNVVMAAAVLHDIGIPNAESKHGTATASQQEEEGPPVARKILNELSYPNGFINEVCNIIAHHHHARDEETVDFRILYDADLLTNASEEAWPSKPGFDADRFLGRFLTASGRRLGEELAEQK